MGTVCHDVDDVGARGGRCGAGDGQREKRDRGARHGHRTGGSVEVLWVHRAGEFERARAGRPAHSGSILLR